MAELKVGAEVEVRQHKRRANGERYLRVFPAIVVSVGDELACVYSTNSGDVEFVELADVFVKE